MSNTRSIDRTSVIDLKPGQENVHVIVRVLETTPPHIIQTRKGPRTISKALLGDETGRVKATLWGRKAGVLKRDQVVDVAGAWTTVFRGQVQLNIGSGSSIQVVNETMVPPKDKIPNNTPKIPRRQGRLAKNPRSPRQNR